MTRRSRLWSALCHKYLKTPLEYPTLRTITLAQWAHESHWGTSTLAKLHHNFAGMNYRRRMRGYALPVIYTSSDGRGKYCHFWTIAGFISGYWQFVSHERYAGWQEYGGRPEQYIRFIAERGYATDQNYASKVLKLHDELLADLHTRTEHPP